MKSESHFGYVIIIAFLGYKMAAHLFNDSWFDGWRNALNTISSIIFLLASTYIILALFVLPNLFQINLLPVPGLEHLILIFGVPLMGYWTANSFIRTQTSQAKSQEVSPMALYIILGFFAIVMIMILSGTLGHN